MRQIVLILAAILALNSNLPAAKPKRETISGLLVAYSAIPILLNGTSYLTLIIRQQSGSHRPEFIQVNASIRGDNDTDWMSVEPKVQKFRLYRAKDCDSKLEQFLETDPHDHMSFPAWQRPPGTEGIALPFGRIIPCYDSVDLHKVPVL